MVKNFLLMAIFLYAPTGVGANNIFDGKTSLKKPFELRDPFAPPQKSRRSNYNRSTDDTVYNTLPDVKNIEVDRVEIVGILSGSERRAVLKNQGNQVFYTVKEGEKIGKNGVEIKAILPGGIVLVEKITNIYGDAEYIETVIPLSK